MRRDTKVARRTPGRTAETADATGRQAQCRDSDVWPRVSLASTGRPDVWADAGLDDPATVWSDAGARQIDRSAPREADRPPRWGRASSDRRSGLREEAGAPDAEGVPSAP